MIINIHGQKKKEGKIPMSCAYAMALAPQVHVPRARVIELAWSMTLMTLARSSLHYTSRTPCHGSRSTISLLDAHQTAFDWTQKFFLRAIMAKAN
jgi:hypothetical protein